MRKRIGWTWEACRVKLLGKGEKGLLKGFLFTASDKREVSKGGDNSRGFFK